MIDATHHAERDCGYHTFNRTSFPLIRQLIASPTLKLSMESLGFMPFFESFLATSSHYDPFQNGLGCQE